MREQIDITSRQIRDSKEEHYEHNIEKMIVGRAPVPEEKKVDKKKLEVDEDTVPTTLKVLLI